MEAPPAPLCLQPRCSQEDRQEDTGRGQQVHPSLDPRHRLDVDGVNGEEETSQEGGGARRQEAPADRQDQDAHGRVQEDVRQVESTRVSLPDEAIQPVRKSGERSKVREDDGLRLHRGLQYVDEAPCSDLPSSRDDQLVIEREIVA